MCDLCVEIKNPEHHTLQKIEVAGEIITKSVSARKLKSQRWEISPFKSERQLEAETKKRVEKLLLELFHEIARKWLRVEKAKGRFTILGNIYINPKTGRPLSKSEWAKIKKQMLQAFGYIYGPEEHRLVRQALTLGYLLRGMPADAAISTSLTGFNLKDKDIMNMARGPLYLNTVTFAQQSVAQHITNLKQNQFNRLHNTILNAIVAKESPRELEKKLFDDFATMNRDWRRVAETEIANSTNNGQLLYDLQTEPKDKPIFQRGLSSSGACPWCQSMVDGKIVVLLDAPPAGGGDKVKVGNVEYTAIWPGKNNVGRSRQSWWVSAGAQHPWCRCNWILHEPDFEATDKKFRAAMEKEMKRVEKMEGNIQTYTPSEYVKEMKKYGAFPET